MSIFAQTTATHDGPGEYNAFANDRPLTTEREARRALAQRHRKVANRRKNHVYQVTAQLVRRHGLIVTEELSIGNMTASAKGRRQSGKNVK